MNERIVALRAMQEHVESFDWDGLTESRRRVLEAFLVLAAKGGYASVTMRDLGEAVDVKAPSLYKHFRDGREEVVREALRWHYYRFAVAVLEAVSKASSDARGFWDELVALHTTRQLAMPESDMFDILVATDRVSGFLSPEGRAEVAFFLRQYAALFEGAAQDMGYRGNITQAVAMVMSVLDDVRDWSGWNEPGHAPVEEVVEAARSASYALLDARAHPSAAPAQDRGVTGTLTQPPTP